MNNNYLQHYGILGMRWGRRRGTSTISKSSEPTKIKNISEDYSKKITLKKKKLHEMSNAELKALNERLQLEKSYKELMKADVSPAKKFVRDLITEIAKDSIKSIVKDTVTGGSNKNQYLKSFMKAKEAVNLTQALAKKKSKGSTP